MGNRRKIGVIILCISLFTILSGCTSPQNENAMTITASAVPVSPQPTVTEYSFAIDPMPDYTTDASFNILDSTALFVNGTTDLPAGTVVTVVMYDENESRNLLVNTRMEIQGNTSGPNSFSRYIFDMKGQPPGRYRVRLGVNTTEYDIMDKTAYRRFNVTSDVPYYKWIGMDPLGAIHPGGIIHVSGMTDLPAGSTILIHSYFVHHSCTSIPSVRENPQSSCGGCDDPGTDQEIPVVQGEGGMNTWNATFNSSTWCLAEKYTVFATAVNWTNVTPAQQFVNY